MSVHGFEFRHKKTVNLAARPVGNLFFSRFEYIRANLFRRATNLAQEADSIFDNFLFHLSVAEKKFKIVGILRPKHRFLAKSVIFDQNCYFWPNILFLANNFISR